jgi:hypothetical protein
MVKHSMMDVDGNSLLNRLLLRDQVNDDDDDDRGARDGFGFLTANFHFNDCRKSAVATTTVLYYFFTFT